MRCLLNAYEQVERQEWRYRLRKWIPHEVIGLLILYLLKWMGTEAAEWYDGTVFIKSKGMHDQRRIPSRQQRWWWSISPSQDKSSRRTRRTLKALLTYDGRSVSGPRLLVNVYFHMSRYVITVYIEFIVFGHISRKLPGIDRYVNPLDLYVIIIE